MKVITIICNLSDDNLEMSMTLSSIDEDKQLMHTLYASGQKRQIWFLIEDGLYEMLMQSRKPIAKEFKKEVKCSNALKVY